jgi:undecaprenyl-diphosphatase
MDQILLLYLYHYAAMHQMSALVVFASVWFIFCLLLLAIAVEFFRHERHWRVLIAAFLSAATGAVAASVFAFLLPMPRPFLVLSDQIVPLIPVMNPLGSLPSGHTATMVAFGFGLLFAGRKSGLVYACFGVLIGLARVAAGVHFPSDVLVGIVFGVVSGALVHQIFRLMEGETESTPSTQKLSR